MMTDNSGTVTVFHHRHDQVTDISFFVFQPTVLVPLCQLLFPSLKFCYRSNS